MQQVEELLTAVAIIGCVLAAIAVVWDIIDVRKDKF